MEHIQILIQPCSKWHTTLKTDISHKHFYNKHHATFNCNCWMYMDSKYLNKILCIFIIIIRSINSDGQQFVQSEQSSLTSIHQTLKRPQHNYDVWNPCPDLKYSQNVDGLNQLNFIIIDNGWMNEFWQKKGSVLQNKMVRRNYYNNLLCLPFWRQQIWNIIFPFF